jgi:nucleotide-binding universal stress UspA family protein
MNTLQTVPETQPSTDSGKFGKILVAVDYLDSTPEIFQKALNLAHQNSSELMIFHCILGQVMGMPEIATATTIGVYGGLYSKDMLQLSEQLATETLEELQAWLRSLGNKAIKLGIKADFEYSVGDPGKKICDKAQEWGADLVILGRRGRKGLAEILLGSVSNYVLHNAPCSVLVIQH